MPFLSSAPKLPFPYRGPFTFLLPAPSAAAVSGSLLHVQWETTGRGSGSEGGARWSGVGWGWGLTRKKAPEFRGQSSWRELAFAFPPWRLDDFPGGRDRVGAKVRPALTPPGSHPLRGLHRPPSTLHVGHPNPLPGPLWVLCQWATLTPVLAPPGLVWGRRGPLQSSRACRVANL